MPSEFVRDHREEIIARCQARVAGRMVPRPTPLELEHGIPLFLRELEQTLACERIAHTETIAVAELLGELEVSAIAGTRARKLRLTVTPIDPEVAVEADRQILSSIISNLLQNAFDTPVLTVMSGYTHARARIACCSRSRTVRRNTAGQTRPSAGAVCRAGQ